MTDRLAIAIAQLNPVVGDIAGNVTRVRTARAEAARGGADLVIFPELMLSGYPPEDLVLKASFQHRLHEAVQELRRDTEDGGPALFVPTPWREDDKLHNAILALDRGAIVGKRFKVDLPNYGVFDEKRVFVPGPMPGPIVFRDVRIGVPICEDIWTPDVLECIAETGGEIVLVPNASPFEADKPEYRLQLGVQRVVESGLPLVYVHQVGGQDELVFDGSSFVLGADRTLRALLPAFQEQVALTHWTREGEGWVCAPAAIAPVQKRLESIWSAMVLGLRDYVGKSGFPGVLIGLSGGIDSAVTACVAVDALGPQRVRTVMMPSPYTSRDSREDAAACARALGVHHDIVSIEPAMRAFRDMLAPLFVDQPEDVTEENIQARARGVTLMALSNKLGSMVLSTGNKSEMAVGYATLYGDMCGGFNPLKDVYKTTVFELARWRNEHRPVGGRGPSGTVIPERIIMRPPSAELRPNQTDQDTLPPYDLLDRILEGLIERDLAVEDLVAQGHDMATVRRVWRMLESAEYKRRQAPPGVKLTSRAISRERRYPIVNRFRG